MLKIGFDNDKYLKMQSIQVLQMQHRVDLY